MQTYQVAASGTMAVAAAGDFNCVSPSLNGLRYGRYLTGISVVSDSPTANLGAWAVYMTNSGLQPGYPQLSPTTAVLYGGNTSRKFVDGAFMLVADNPAPLPIWCPPGTFFRLYVNMTAGSGSVTLTCSWNTTEDQDTAGNAIGMLRSPIKV